MELRCDRPLLPALTEFTTRTLHEGDGPEVQEAEGWGFDIRYTTVVSVHCQLHPRSSSLHKRSNLMPEKIIFTIPLLPQQPPFTPRTLFHTIILRKSHAIYP